MASRVAWTSIAVNIFLALLNLAIGVPTIIFFAGYEIAKQALLAEPVATMVNGGEPV